jgi:hypothetical protein
MADPWRYVERACPEHWLDMDVLRTILEPHDAIDQGAINRTLHCNAMQKRREWPIAEMARWSPSVSSLGYCGPTDMAIASKSHCD